MMIGESAPLPAPHSTLWFSESRLVFPFSPRLLFFVAIVFPRQPCSRTQVHTVHACLVDGFLESKFHERAQLNETKVGASNGLHLTKLSNLASRSSLIITYSRATCPARREHNSPEMFFFAIDRSQGCFVLYVIDFVRRRDLIRKFLDQINHARCRPHGRRWRAWR